jgi:putative flippase GtrA
MSSLIGRFRAFRASPHFTRIWKFATVSVITTTIAQGLLFIVYPHLVASAMGSNIIVTAIATVPAYWLNRTWTWGKRGKSHLWKEVMPFWVMAFVGLVLSTVIVGLAAKNADRISSAHDVKVAIVHLANFFSYGLIWIARYSLLNKYLFGTSTQNGAAGTDVDTVAVGQVGDPAATAANGSVSFAPASAEASAPASAEASVSASASVGAAGEPVFLPVDPSH